MKPDVRELPIVTLSPAQQFKDYRRMLASMHDTRVHWWYFGTALVTLEGLPPLPVINAATLMVYRTETLAADRFAIHWDEVGYFADFVTGEPADSWVNPVTGRRMASPQGFAEGPARYEIATTNAGLAVTLTQPGAKINSIEVSWRVANERQWLIQKERKTRGFPEVDGKLPAPDSASGFEALTELTFIDDRAGSGLDTRGLYAFALAGAPPWMGFDPVLRARATVHGVILKAAPESPPRPASLRILQGMYPEFFARHSVPVV
jgi:hypothetical protein